MKMALQFHIDVVRAKNAGQAFHRAPSFLHAALSQRGGKWTIIAAGEADQPGSMLLQFVFADGALTFLRAQLHLRNQMAEVLVAGAGRNEKGKAKPAMEAQRFERNPK